MKNKLLFLFLLTGLLSCNFPTELPLLESVKPADKFSRTFIDKIITGQLESAFSDLEPEILNDKAREFMTNASQNIKGAKVKKYSIVEENVTSGYISSKGKFTNYRLGYEYEFENGNNILFTTAIKEKDGKFSVLAFDGQVLEVPLAEQTKFSFTDKPLLNYIFLSFSIIVPIFILITLILMLRSKIIRKRKIIWALIILFVSIPTFIVNWNTGAVDFKLFNFVLLGTGFVRPTLYSPWLLSFGIPIGGLLYWLRRDNLLREFEQQSEEYSQ